MTPHTDPGHRPGPPRAAARQAVPEYAVILDHHRATFPEHWPIVRVARTLVDAGRCRQYEVVTQVRPRSQWNARPCRRVELTHVPTGAIHPGGVYQLTARLPPKRGLSGPGRGAAVAVLLGLTALVLGCAGPTLTRRYAAAHWTTTPPANAPVRVSAFVLPAAPAPEPVAEDTIDRTRFRRRLVVSVEKTDAVGPADRIAALVVRLARPIPGRFVSWDKLATQYETVDLGKLSLARGASFELGGEADEAGVLGLPATGRATFKATRALTEDVSLRQRTVGLTGTLRADEARLTQEGAAGLDLAGNAVVDLDLAVTAAPAPYDVLRVTGLGGGGAAAAGERRAGAPVPSVPSVRRVALRYPAAATPLTCELGGHYTMRVVREGAATIAEGDDRVDFVRGEFPPATVTLVEAEDLVARIWGLRTTGDELVYCAGAGLAEFASYAEAAACADWLRASGEPRVAGHDLRVGGAQGPLLTKEQLAALVVQVRRLN